MVSLECATAGIKMKKSTGMCFNNSMHSSCIFCIKSRIFRNLHRNRKLKYKDNCYCSWCTSHIFSLLLNHQNPHQNLLMVDVGSKRMVSVLCINAVFSGHSAACLLN